MIKVIKPFWYSKLAFKGTGTVPTFCFLEVYGMVVLDVD
jgi:hypothetical protein